MIDHLLTDTAEVYRATLVPDGRGGRTRSFASIGFERVKVNQPTASEQDVAARLGALQVVRVHARYGADIERGDELDVGWSRRLRVVAVLSNSGRTYRRVECEEVQGGS